MLHKNNTLTHYPVYAVVASTRSAGFVLTSSCSPSLVMASVIAAVFGKKRSTCYSARELVDIDALTEINGLSIEEIERRARPLDDKSVDPTSWRFRCGDGFLGVHESFKGVLKHDWETVAALGTSHQQIAHHLRQVIAKTEEARTKSQWGAMKPIAISYSCTPPPPATAATAPAAQTLLVSHYVFNGDQCSVFFNNDKQGSVLNTKWREEYTIENVRMQLSVKVAGTATDGVIDYIDRFGFYEGGGIANSYRVEPELVWAILTGICTQQTVQVACARERHARLHDIECELQHYPTVILIPSSSSSSSSISTQDSTNNNNTGEEPRANFANTNKQKSEELEWMIARVQQLQQAKASAESEIEKLAQHWSQFIQ